jgi:hypothetical protein
MQRASALREAAAADTETEEEQLEQTVAIVRSLVHSPAGSDQQTDALTQEVVALAEAGHHEQAVTVARSITDPEQGASALAKVAVTLAKAGDNIAANRLAAAACTLGRWTAASPVLLLDANTPMTLVRVIGNNPVDNVNPRSAQRTATA